MRPIPVMWVYKVKKPSSFFIGCQWQHRALSRHGWLPKASGRRILLPSSSLEGADFDEVFVPVSKYSTLRALMALAAVEDLEVHQLDIKTAFLNGVLQEEVYIQLPTGYHEGGPDVGCHLHRALYGLRQAPRAWHIRLTEELATMGFRPSAADPGLHFLDAESVRVNCWTRRYTPTPI